ncbi:unnamed protein product [Caenorhabditis auriculariae]|uniref:Uncharacterized protein n=1 Tax=Caenorhabditis auriculariae TaxID=2777116 RepID=A0A8S1H9A5_9PELO|nr:unnamed protein product [Caenorhabditis auriculariae]
MGNDVPIHASSIQTPQNEFLMRLVSAVASLIDRLLANVDGQRPTVKQAYLDTVGLRGVLYEQEEREMQQLVHATVDRTHWNVVEDVKEAAPSGEIDNCGLSWVDVFFLTVEIAHHASPLKIISK